MTSEPLVPRSELISEMTGRLRSRLWLVTLILIIAYLGMMGITFVPKVAHALPEVVIFFIREIGGGILIVALGTAILQLVLPAQQFENKLAEFLKTDLREDIAKQAQIVLAASSSLDAMHRLGVLRVYADRDQARDELTRDLRELKAGEILLTGISLKDFTRPERPMYGAWRSIQQLLMKPAASVNARILISDPYSLGVQLHAMAGVNITAADLTDDIKATAKFLQNTQTACNGTLDFKLYRTAPQIFMCQMPFVTYMQPYAFGDDIKGHELPILKVASTSALHANLKGHFETLWSQASITPSEFLEGHAIGSDPGVYQSGIFNIYPNPMTANGRIQWAIRRANGRLWLKGMSLRSYLDSSRSLYQELARLLRNQQFTLRLLILDPNSEQAYFRSFRERQLKGQAKDLTFKDYVEQENRHLSSKLVEDTHRAIRGARDLAESANGTVELRLYSTAPAFFVLLSDSAALIEQYHYGQFTDNISPEKSPTLGKDMPLIEYSREPSLFHVKVDRASPFSLLESDFLFVWDQAKDVSLAS